MTQQKTSGRGVAIAMMFLLFAMISFVTGLASPIGVILKDQFGASGATSQLGNLANFIAYAFMGIPAGLLLQRVGYKKTALIAVAVGLVGVAIQFYSGVAASFAVYVAGAFVAGFSMCLLNTVVNPMLNTLGGGGNKGNQLIQFGGSLNSMAATITPVLVGYLIGNTVRPTIENANPALFIAMGIFAVVFVVLALVRIPEPEQVAETSTEKPRSPMSFRHFVQGIIGIFIYVGVEVGIPAFLILYLTKGLGMDTAIAGSVAGTYWLLMLVGRLTGASVGAKVSAKTMLTVASGLGMVFVLLAIFLPADIMTRVPAITKELSFSWAQAPISVLLLVLCGLCTSIMWGGIFNLAVEGLGSAVKKASGIFMVMVCGGGILPVIQGFVADKAGTVVSAVNESGVAENVVKADYMASYWVIFAGLVFLLYYALAGSRIVQPKK
ncbi:MAG: MFS transporter [Rikenellaceae bacterium]|jgi:FHS family L-fucose permease-like MFS transporter|nr:MFS transporter [Rikenellaceae bacterium]